MWLDPEPESLYLNRKYYKYEDFWNRLIFDIHKKPLCHLTKTEWSWLYVLFIPSADESLPPVVMQRHVKELL